jgi:mannose/fructose/N-acetylgalactosamine-specific phosphotransferase system component IIC
MIGLEISPGTWLVVTILGVGLGLDGTSLVQSMASRPIVAATIGGMLFGDPGSGFLAGGWLELVSGRHPPFGAARYPETGPASLIAGSAFALSEHGSILALVAATAAGWAIGWIGTHSIQWLRRVNEKAVGDPAAYAGDPAELARRHRRAIRLDGARAAVITGALFVPAVLSARWLESWPAGPAGGAWASLAALIALAGLGGSGARVLGGRRQGWPSFVLGGVAALLLLRILG